MRKRTLVALGLIITLITGCGVKEEQDTPANADSVAVTEDEKEAPQAEDDLENVGEESLETGTYAIGLNPEWRNEELNVIDDKYRTYYEIFVYSFCDSDGDGIGDLNGVCSKLDYLNDGDPQTDDDLGINGIWLMPIMPSPSYHKYDTTDYMSVDSAYGSVQDMENLIVECHKRGINIIIDLALNHSSGEHPWFTTACDYLRSLPEGGKIDAKECPYVDYYHFSNTKESGYCEVTESEWYYEARFNYDMPDLNLMNDDVRKEFEDIADYWLDMGVDGFRLDAVKYYETGKDDTNIEILSWFNDYVKKSNPDAYIVCENWSDQTAYCSYYSSGVDSLFDFKFADKDGVIAKTVGGNGKASAYGSALADEEVLYAEYSDEYINAPFYTNHDMGRSAGYYSGDYALAQTKMGHALNLIMSGNAFIYYGEELGMKGSGADENKRAPMYWSDDSTYPGICVGPPNMEDVKMKYGSFEDQVGDQNSIYNYVKDLIRLRNQIPAIARGETKCIDNLSDDDVCVISKTYNGETIFIVLNISDKTRTVDLSSLANGNLACVGEVYADSVNVSRDANVFTLPDYSLIVLSADSEMLSEEADYEGEYLPGYETENDFKSRHTGSASYIDGRTVLCTIFVDEPENVWTKEDKERMLNTCDIAYSFIMDYLKENYDADVELIYDWTKDAQLVYSVKANEDIPAYVTSEQEDHMDELEAGWVSSIDVRSIMQKYDATSIGFLYMVPHEGCSYSSMHFIDDGAKTWNEGCLLYLQDMYSPTYDYETPTVFAHELLHLFGAEDYYSSAEVFSKETYDTLKKLCPDDIMLKMFDKINGVYTTYHDKVKGEITKVTAYSLGIGNEEDVSELEELIKDERACFSGSMKDRPF